MTLRSTFTTLYAAAERFWWETNTGRVVMIIAILAALRFLAATSTPLLWDEAYYWLWSLNPAAGYFDHPPMIALWIRAGTAIAGDGIVGMRLAGFVSYLIAPFAVYAIGRLMFDHAIAIRGVLWANVAPLLSIAGILATPDLPSTLFWILTTLAYVLVVRTGRGGWWLAVGLLAGLGAASKYTNLFLGAGIVLSLALDPRLRRWLVSPWLWAGGAVALAVFSPVIAWNHANDWASFRFQFGRITPDGFDPSYFLTLIIVQPLIFNPLASVFLAMATATMIAHRNTAYSREVRLLLATIAPALVFILFQSTYTIVLQHWLAPTFPTLALVAVVGATSLGADSPSWLRRMRTDVVPLAITSMVIVFAYANSTADRFFPGKDPTEALRGWPDFAEQIYSAQEAAGASWIASVGYEMTSQFAYELRGRARVVPVTERRRYSFMAEPDPALLAQPALLVVSPRQAMDMWHACFTGLTLVGTAERRGTAKTWQKTNLYLATGPVFDLFESGCDLRS